ncbi:MAG: hypothetical protein AB7T38_09065 [Nitrospirales bacterium]
MTRRTLVSCLAAMLAFTFFLLPAQASDRADAPVVGLYIGKTDATSGPYKIYGHYFNDSYLYLFPDGTFYDKYSFYGYDEFDTATFGKSGRYSVQGDQVTFQYPNGEKVTVQPGGRQPNCDSLKLSGTFELSGFGIFISFSSDGRFVDRGAMPQILNLTDSRLDSPARSLRPGPGSYSIKNHTITLRYADGPVFRLFFYVDGDDRGEIDPNHIHIHTFKLSREVGSPAEQPSTPATHLPKIQAPAGWKSQRDGGRKSITYFVPSDLPQGRNLVVAVNDPQSLANPDVSRFPERIHEAGVQGGVKNLIAEGWHTESAMARNGHRKVLSSEGVFSQLDGKKFWIAMFTLISKRESQSVFYMSDQEELYKTYLPTVRAMLGDGDTSSLTRTTALIPIPVMKQGVSAEVYLLAGKSGGPPLVLFDDGTFHAGMPYEGLDRVDQKRLIQQAPVNHKGTYSRDDKKLTLTFGEETEVFTPTAYGWKGGEENKLIRLPPADDFQFDGTFVPMLDNPTLSDPTITLTRDGHFVDRGIFRLQELSTSSVTSQVSTPPREGKGRYLIRNYTLILSYENGLERRIGIMGLPLDNAVAKTIPFFIHHVPFRRQE